MEEAKNLLKGLEEKYKHPFEKQLIITLNEQMKNEHNKIEESIKNLQDSIQLLKKKNIQIEGDVRKLSYIEIKRCETYAESNQEKLKLAKSIVELEDEVEKMRSKINKKEKEIYDIEEAIRNASHPSLNEIYLEIIKGFGVELIDRENKKTFKIKNKKMNDIYEIEVNENKPVSETCNEIWSKM